MSKIKELLNKRYGYFILFLFLFWLKTYIAYWIEFSLGVSGIMENIILFINPIATGVIVLSIALFFKSPTLRKWAMFTLLLLMTLLLYVNILYYREFADFLTFNIVSSTNNVTGALFTSTFEMMRIWDLLYWVDIMLFGYLFFYKKETPFAEDKKTYKRRTKTLVTSLGVLLLAGNLILAEIDRPELLTRTFDRNYIVKYLGLNFFTGYDVFQASQNSQMRVSADESDLGKVFNFASENHAAPNPEYFGVAEDRNVIVIGLESVQQFLIDYELEDEYGETHEVMPFLSSIYDNEDSYSFENFFHQTGQGKSSDAEVLGELSLYGLPQGSVFQTLGSTNTFHSASNILEQHGGYTSAAFHGNVGSFWNRTDTYRSFGYDYFFDSEFYDVSGDRSMEYGLKDKLFFHDSVEYLEQLPQPFYSKFLTVSHHFPYPLDEENVEFPAAQTDDNTINNYFVTAHYADQALEEFFNYLKSSGLYEDSIIVMYGDHYGISDMRNPELAPLVGEDPEEWNDYHNTQIQRVPFIMHVPGVENGEVFDTYSGQVDMLPTLMHLLGIETDGYLFMGQDILSEEHDNTVPLRNGRVITPEYTFLEQEIYDTETGEPLLDQFTEEELEELYLFRNEAREELNHSNEILMKDLLRFYNPEPLDELKEIDYLYRDQLDILEEHPGKETSLIEQRDGESSRDLYETDAPEMEGTESSASEEYSNSPGQPE
ncbi:LTA synthase family protein [Salinicoccus kekensis]|uniref:Lipoteichoic acid synthase n=1 Tax=Salinicoccus kekensis TaxID=714307 RepID=A0A285UGC7_9STAP|nr:LTA synthase family protein [Salinicoccus kekensis]SOC40727.1 lipoteichoic acid synthase [Salinicoccus kekensis]